MIRFRHEPKIHRRRSFLIAHPDHPVVLGSKQPESEGEEEEEEGVPAVVVQTQTVEIDELRDKLAAFKARNLNLMSKVEGAQYKLALAEDRSEALQKAVDDLKEVTEKNAESIEEMASKIKEAERKLASCETERSGLIARGKRLREEKEEAEKALAHCETERTGLINKNAKLEKLKNDIDAAEKRVKDAAKKISVLEKKLSTEVQTSALRWKKLFRDLIRLDPAYERLYQDLDPKSGNMVATLRDRTSAYRSELMPFLDGNKKRIPLVPTEKADTRKSKRTNKK